MIKYRIKVLKSRNLPSFQEVPGNGNCFINLVRGSIFGGFNRRKNEDQQMGGYILINCAYTYIHLEFQPSLSSHKIISTKMEYEKHCKMMWLFLKDIFNNNQLIISRKFYEHPSRFYQISRFTDARSCHHNVIAGNVIKKTMSVVTRTASSTLWTMPVKQISFILTMQCVTPMDSWTQISSLELDDHRRSP